MISVRSSMRGHPGATTRVATVDTPAEAIQVVKTLRSHGIKATWKPERPFIVRVDAENAPSAVKHLKRLVGLWFAIENGDVYTETDHQRFTAEHDLA